MQIIYANPSEWLIDAVMVTEALLWSEGVVNLTKAAASRPRPYVYHDDRKSSEFKKDASRSFFSGHSTFAFTGAVIASTLINAKIDSDRLKRWIWISELSAAAPTAALRVASGKHFPSDVIVGAAVGGFTGWIIPRIHRRSDDSRLSIRIFPDLGLSWRLN